MSSRPGAAKTGARHAAVPATTSSGPSLSPAAAGSSPAIPWLSRQQRGWLAAAAALAVLWIVFRTRVGGSAADSTRLLGVTKQRCRSGEGRESPLAQALGTDVRGWQGGTPLGCVAMSSFYQRWIRGDLQRWEGERVAVTRAMVDAAASPACDEHKLRFQILNGTLWVDHSMHMRAEAGWYPAPMGQGWVSAKARVPYAILALMDALRAFPGQIPDVDAVLQVSDHPCMPADPTNPWPQFNASHLAALNVSTHPPPAVFNWDMDPEFVDIPFPDFSYWGHEVDRFRGPGGQEEGTKWVHGWEAQLAHILATSRSLPFAERTPVAAWRGRHEGGRDWLRNQFMACPATLNKSGRGEDGKYFSLWEPDVRLDQQYLWRYIVYIEAEAWATNLKHKLASGSLVFTPGMRHAEFFGRALEPHVHHVPLGTKRMCQELVDKVKQMERAVEQEVGKIPDGKQEGGRRSRLMLADERRGRRLASAATKQPWKIGEAAQQFVVDHVRMTDVLEYIRDVLRGYGAVMAEAPVASPGAVCYDGPRLLEQFAYPFKQDGEDVMQTYPWLAGWDGGCPAAGK